MIVLDNLSELIRKVERLKEQKSKSRGALDQLLKRLKKEFGCNSLKEAKVLLKKKEEEERSLAIQYSKKKKRFEERWKGELK